MEEVRETFESSGRTEERLRLRVDTPEGLAGCLTVLTALSLLILVGLLNCLMSHIHSMPSFENETMLLAI
jgi:hypothetical protein